MHFAMGAKNCLTLECVHSVSRHVMSKNALSAVCTMQHTVQQAAAG